MGTVYAIANQKGGVGKTTTAVNVAACISEAGYPTLLVDIDPQANATVGLGVAKDSRPSVYDVLAGTATPSEAIVTTTIDGLSLMPAHPDLAGATVELPREPGSETACATRCPPCASASPTRSSTARRRWAAHCERARRLRPGDRAGADGVLRARGLAACSTRWR